MHDDAADVHGDLGGRNVAVGVRADRAVREGGELQGVHLVQVPAGAPDKAAACVSKVLTTMDADLSGSCSALVLLGQREGADKAATELSAPAEKPAGE